MQIRKRILAGLRECSRSLVKNWDISHIYIYIYIYMDIYIYIYILYVYIYIATKVFTCLLLSLLASRSQSKRSMRWERRACGGWNMSKAKVYGVDQKYL